MKSILDPSFRYTPSVKTDLRKAFAKVRRELRAVEVARARSEVEANTNVRPLGQRKQGGSAAHWVAMARKCERDARAPLYKPQPGQRI